MLLQSRIGKRDDDVEDELGIRHLLTQEMLKALIAKLNDKAAKSE